MANDKGLTILQKIKLLMGAKAVVDQVKDQLPAADPAKPTIWAKLDGTKSITGLLMIVAYYALPQFGVKVPDIFLTIGTAWAGVGLAHKFDKVTGTISAIAMALTRTNDVINGDKK